jgi:hypothetical protein
VRTYLNLRDVRNVEGAFREQGAFKSSTIKRSVQKERQEVQSSSTRGLPRSIVLIRVFSYVGLLLRRVWVSLFTYLGWEDRTLKFWVVCGPPLSKVGLGICLLVGKGHDTPLV